jgi:hypothetical protein
VGGSGDGSGHCTSFVAFFSSLHVLVHMYAWCIKFDKRVVTYVDR